MPLSTLPLISSLGRSQTFSGSCTAGATSTQTVKVEGRDDGHGHFEPTSSGKILKTGVGK